MGADSVVKLLQCYPHVDINDLDVIDFLIEQMNTKLATGEAFSELSSDDFVRLTTSLKSNPNSPLTPQVLQRLDDYVTNNPSQFSIEERNKILRSIGSTKFKNNISTPVKQTPADVKNAIKFGMGVKETKEIDLNFSPVENCYSLYFTGSQTRV
jgi:hypothetical protein